MNASKTYTVKGMVCQRCITILQYELEQHHVKVDDVSLGKVGISFQSDNFNDSKFLKIISSLGFTLSINKNNRVVEQVKVIVRNYYTHTDPLETKMRFSDLLSDQLHMSYDTISSIFIAHENTTIENYIIAYRIELVKKMLGESEHSITEIAYRIGFSSIHHLSKQFKDLTGTTPSDYRAQANPKNVISNSSDNILMAGI